MWIFNPLNKLFFPRYSPMQLMTVAKEPNFTSFDQIMLTQFYHLSE